MKSITEFGSLYLHRRPVDMRKNINGLSVLVKEGMGLDLKSSSLFIFCNQRRTHLKILYFDKSGFALWLKRLEGSKFSWPKNLEQEVVSINQTDMALLLEGVNIWSRFEEVHFDYLV
jgi:transposase